MTSSLCCLQVVIMWINQLKEINPGTKIEPKITIEIDYASRNTVKSTEFR